jgi:hypothetical protein
MRPERKKHHCFANKLRKYFPMSLNKKFGDIGEDTVGGVWNYSIINERFE